MIGKTPQVRVLEIRIAQLEAELNQALAQRDDAQFWTRIYKGRYSYALKFVPDEKLQVVLWFDADDPEWLKAAKWW